ncbi:hypothetical protein [Streptomyces synnematoformans]|uniref:Uncharacterized protein n=1 Tax=Streptomyces synnematoformans TaxID=415721 RepID=A0ABP5IWC9_9ACTN
MTGDQAQALLARIEAEQWPDGTYGGPRPPRPRPGGRVRLAKPVPELAALAHAAELREALRGFRVGDHLKPTNTCPGGPAADDTGEDT